MPYITCPDGKTYSRYDTSPYVKWCIKCQEEQYRLEEIKCMKDPQCRMEQENKNTIINGIAFSIGLILIFLFVITFRELKK